MFAYEGGLPQFFKAVVPVSNSSQASCSAIGAQIWQAPKQICIASHYPRAFEVICGYLQLACFRETEAG